MKNHIGMKVFAFLAATIILSACAEQPATEFSVIYVMRHAEKGTGDDPALTSSGEERARQLAYLLGQSNVTSIHSTNTRRTRTTVDPLASAVGLEVLLYSASDQSNLARTLSVTNGRHVVIGHSDTIREFVSAAGGEAGPPILDDEYDRSYVLIIDRGVVRTLHHRYGGPYED